MQTLDKNQRAQYDDTEEVKMAKKKGCKKDTKKKKKKGGWASF